MLTKIKLLGALGEEFVKEIELCVNSTHEAMWALQQLYPRFKSWVLEQSQHGLAYEVFVGDYQIGEDELKLPSGGDEIVVVPLVGGSGGNIFKIIGGLALIGIGIATGGAGFLGLSSTSLLLAGGALLLSGIVGSLQPKNKEDGEKNSLIFGNSTEVTRVGAAKPCVFGVHACSGLIISARIRTFQLA